MAQVHDTLLTPPNWLVQYCRDQVYDPESGLVLHNFGIMADMWFQDGLVRVHRDDAPAGFWTYVWVMLNDMDSRLREVDGDTDMPVGTLLCFDAHMPHHTVANSSGRTAGRLAIVSWDMPHFGYTLDDFRRDLVEKRMKPGF